MSTNTGDNEAEIAQQPQMEEKTSPEESTEVNQTNRFIN